MRAFRAIVFLAVIAALSPAHAYAQGVGCFQNAVVASLTANPSTIVAGDSTLLRGRALLVLSVPDTCSGAIRPAEITAFGEGPTLNLSATFTVTSGDGQTVVRDIHDFTLLGGIYTPQLPITDPATEGADLASFIYLTPGVYAPTFTATFFYDRPFQTVDLINHTVIDSGITHLSRTASLSTQVTVLAIPEPEIYAAMLAGLALLGFARRAGKRT